MKTVKSERQAELCSLILLAFSKKSLKKVVLSKPDAIDEIKSVISPKEISGNLVLQLETFSKDNKAYHLNIRDGFEEELLKILSRYAQINVVTTAGDAQFMRSKSGKESIIGTQKIMQKLENESFVAKAPAAVVEAEREKLQKYRENLEGVLTALSKLN